MNVLLVGFGGGARTGLFFFFGDRLANSVGLLLSLVARALVVGDGGHLSSQGSHWPIVVGSVGLDSG